MSNKTNQQGSGEPGNPVTQKHLHDDDDAIVVPKGTSKLRFLFILGLTILILVIFTVGDQVTQSVGRQPQATDDVTWDGPGVGKRVINAVEFLDEKRREDLFRGVFSQSGRFEDEELAGELLLDEIAKQCGIEISNAELTKAIYEGYPGLCPAMQNKEFYLAVLGGSRVTPRVFEGVLRRKLRIDRYQAFLRGAILVADTAAIDAEWKRTHPQNAYDVVELAHASFDEAAKAEQPDEAGMRAWFDAIPDKRSAFLADFSLPSNAAELIAFRFGAENSAEGLLAKYPLPADKDAEQLAKDYYNQYSSVRFVRETPLPEGLPESEGKNRLINSYEEISTLAMREALVVQAFRAFVADLKERKIAGTAIDLASEAAALGLSHRPVDGAKSESEWSTLEGYGGPFLARSINGTQAGDFGADVTIDRGGVAFTRVTEKNTSNPPTFDAVKEKAVAEWLKRKTLELAQTKLNAIRDALPKAEGAAPNQNPTADEAAFKAAVEALGLSVERRDWMSAIEQNNDPEASKPSHEFIRFNGFLRNLPAGEVVGVQQDRSGSRSYLVRALGQREPLEAKLTPGDVVTIKAALARKNFESFIEANLTPKALATRYKLRVRGSTDIPQPGA